MSEELYLWICRWDGKDGFQHYRPERDRPPAWIKHYTKQLHDSRYLRLTDRQRALLVDLRCIFAVSMLRTPYDHRVIGLHRQMRTYCADLEALNQAGFIEAISREVLDQNLERVYASRAREEEVEVDLEQETPPSPPSERGGDRPPARSQDRRPWRSEKRSDEVPKPTPEQQAALLDHARTIAANWNGNDSSTFDSTLDQLQIDHGARLTSLERDELWDTAFQAAPAATFSANGQPEPAWDGESA